MGGIPTLSDKYSESDYEGFFDTRPTEPIEALLLSNISRNSNTPPNVLKEIFQRNIINNASNLVFENKNVDKSEAIAWLAEPEAKFAFDRYFNQDIQQAIVQYQNPELTIRLIQNQHLNNQVIDSIIQQDNLEVSLALANKSYLPGSYLFELSRSEHEEVRSAVEAKFQNNPDLFSDTVQRFNDSTSENLDWASDILNNAALQIWNKGMLEEKLENYQNLSILIGKNYELHRVSQGEIPNEFGDMIRDYKAQIKVRSRESGEFIAAIDEVSQQVLYALPSERDKVQWNKISEALGLSKANTASISSKAKESNEIERD